MAIKDTNLAVDNIVLYNWYYFGIVIVKWRNHMALRPTENRHPLSSGLHALMGEQVVARVADAQIAAMSAVRAAIPQITRAAEAGAASLGSGGRMGYAGAGSSGLMAMADCLELPGTFGIAPDRVPMLFAGGAQALMHMRGGVEDDAAAALADLDRSGLGRGDTLLCLAASGGTPYTITIARAARAQGVTVAGLANAPGAPLLELADIPVLLDTGPEIVTGSTRMAAGTAQKLALNMVSVLVGLRLGHIHDGYMVNLVADNAKLMDRAARIVADLAGVGLERATAALDAAQGSVKLAILLALGVPMARAQSDLRASGGHLAPLLSRQDQENSH